MNEEVVGLLNLSPKTLKVLKVSFVVVGIAAGAIVAGVILYKTGMLGSTDELVEELVETATSSS